MGRVEPFERIGSPLLRACRLALYLAWTVLLMPVQLLGLATHCSWTATFPRSLIPPAAKLSFWALDADEPKLYLLKDDRSAAR